MCGSDLQWEDSSPPSKGKKSMWLSMLASWGQIGELFYPWCDKELRGAGGHVEGLLGTETDCHTVPRVHLRFAVTCVKAQAAGLCFAPAAVIPAQAGSGVTMALMSKVT